MDGIFEILVLVLVGVAARSVCGARGDVPVIREPDSIEFSIGYDFNPNRSLYRNYGRQVDKRGYVYSSDEAAFLVRNGNAVLPKPDDAAGGYGNAVSSTQIMRAARLINPNRKNSYQVYFVCAEESETAFVYQGYEIVSETRVVKDPNNPNGTIEEEVIIGTQVIDIPTSYQNLSKPDNAPAPTAKFCHDIEGGSFVNNNALSSCNVSELFVTAWSSTSAGYVARYELNFDSNPAEMGEFNIVEVISGPRDVAGFGHKVVAKGDWLVVSSVINGVVVIYKRMIEQCQSRFIEYQRLSGMPDSFGQDISITFKDLLWVGSWREDKVYIYGTGLQWTEKQVLQGVAGERFGFSVVGMGDTYGFVGAPGANFGGGTTYFFKKNCQDPALAFIEADRMVFNESQHYGYEIGTDGCRTALLGGGDGEAVYRWNADISAYFDEYCTCVVQKSDREYAQHYMFHDDLGLDSCQVQVSHQLYECQMGGAPYLCNYGPQHGWVFTAPREQITDLPSFKCVPPEHQFVRRRWMFNCLHDVVVCP